MILEAGDETSAGDLDSRPVLIVTGLVQEARIAAGPGMTVICSSSDPKQLRALLTVFDPSTIRGVISFGVAGGLDPSLKSGDVVVATEVLAGDTRWLAGLALNEELIANVALGRRRVVRGGQDAFQRGRIRCGRRHQDRRGHNAHAAPQHQRHAARPRNADHSPRNHSVITALH